MLSFVFMSMPFVMVMALALGVCLSLILAYSSFGFGLAFIAVIYGLDVLTMSSPILNLGLTIYAADLPLVLIGAVAALRLVFAKDSPKFSLAWVIFATIFFVNLGLGLGMHGTTAGVQARNDFYALATATYAMSFRIDRDGIRKLLNTMLWLCVFILGVCVYRWTVYYGGFTDLLPPGGTYNIDGAIRVVHSGTALVLGQSLLIAIFFFHLGGAARALRALTLFLASAVLVLQHRSVWLATLVGVGLSMFLAKAKQVSRLQQVALLVGVVMVVGAAVLFGGGVGDAIKNSAARAVQGKDTVSSRFENWRTTLSDWVAAGPRAIAIGRERGIDTDRMVWDGSKEIRISYGAHNNYVSTLVSSGVFGFAALAWAILKAAKGLLSSRRANDEDGPFASLLLVLLLVQLVYYVAYSTDYFQFLIFGMSLALAQGIKPSLEVPSTKFRKTQMKHRPTAKFS